MRRITVAVIQMACGPDRRENLRTACGLVETAAAAGAGIVLLQGLFETPYLCIDRDPALFAEAIRLADNPAVAAMRRLGATLGVVIPVGFLELGGDGRRHNGLAVVDAGGAPPSTYRTSHIPDFPACEEAFCFAPGDTGFRMWDTAAGRIGCGICWDQWFPETARIMALWGAALLLCPTAFGRPTVQGVEEVRGSRPHWRRTMQGHGAASQMMLAASSRIGTETGAGDTAAFCGAWFVADATGGIVAECDRTGPGVALASFEPARDARSRQYRGVWRSRRPDLHAPMITEPPPADLRDRVV